MQCFCAIGCCNCVTEGRIPFEVQIFVKKFSRNHNPSSKHFKLEFIQKPKIDVKHIYDDQCFIGDRAQATESQW